DGVCINGTVTVTVNNVAPTVDAGPDQSTDEGTSLTLSQATLNDTGTLDTHTATVNWGDGTETESTAVSESPFGPPGSTSGATGTISVSHTYAQDGVYTLTVCATDDEDAQSCDTLKMIVRNTPPHIDTFEVPDAGEPVTPVVLNASFADQGAGDTHSATIDWGDGTVEPAAVTQDTGAGTVSGSHAYAKAGAYKVTVTVRDNAGGSSSQQGTVDIVNGNVAVKIARTRIVIRGDASNNTIRIAPGNPGSNTYVITGLTGTRLNNAHQPVQFVAGPRTVLFLDMGRGNDSVYLEGAPGPMPIANAVQITLGDGNDRVQIASATLGVRTVIDAGRGDDEVHIMDAILSGQLRLDSGMGDDEVEVLRSRFNGAVNLLTGLGNDLVTIDDSVFENNVIVDTGFARRNLPGDDDRILVERNGDPSGPITEFKRLAQFLGRSGNDTFAVGVDGQAGNAAQFLDRVIFDGSAGLDLLDAGVHGGHRNQFRLSAQILQIENVLS
ncbi:MAG: hypothetical protein HY000_30145, partial [Planctomycetes bacterium]|nr:hypothetical protein [Planctomycetota bacterium]